MDTELKPRSSARRSSVGFPPRVITLFCLFLGISIYYILHRQRQPAAKVEAKSPKSKLGKILTAKRSMPNLGTEPGPDALDKSMTVASVQYPFQSVVSTPEIERSVVTLYIPALSSIGSEEGEGRKTVLQHCFPLYNIPPLLSPS